jgi:hypothetical protein
VKGSIDKCLAGKQRLRMEWREREEGCGCRSVFVEEVQELLRWEEKVGKVRGRTLYIFISLTSFLNSNTSKSKPKVAERLARKPCWLAKSKTLLTAENVPPLFRYRIRKDKMHQIISDHLPSRVIHASSPFLKSVFAEMFVQ